jgi:tetratricopeptide (TPR) repeat protein
LSAVFYDPSLDGYNRLLAFIRIIFITYNYRRFDLLPDKLAYLEKKIATGEFYSRRIVSNFYSQQLLYCARESMLDQAECYGYLSIRFPNSDYLYYLNNLASVLLRNQKPQEALQVLRQAIKQARESQNPHSRIGHAAFLGMALIRTRQARQAALHCETFFKAYQQQVFEHRWHLFFCAWTEALLELEQYPKIFRLKEQWDLEAKDTQYRKQHHYLPVLPMLWGMAAYFQQHLTLAQLQESLTQEMNKLRARKDQAPMSGWQNIVRTMEQKIPELKPWFASNDLC